MAWPFTKWTWNNGGDGGWEPDFVYEVWHAGETEMSQTIEGLPAGKYIATVQGYYRDGDNHNNDGTIYQGDRQEAYFFAGDARVLLPNISVGADQYLLRGNNNAGHGIVPDSREDAAAYFGAGLYKVSVETTVGADGKLKIGAIKSANVPNDWMVIDNFRLFYKGNYVEATITDAGYATFVAPGFIDDIPAGVEAYAAQLKEGYVHLEPTSVIPAGEAVVLKGAEGTYTFYPQAVSETPVSTSEYSIDLSYTKGDVSYDDGVAIINGEADCKVLKIGTSKAVGNFTLTVPAGKYSFYAVAWKGTGTSDVVLKNGDEVVKTVTVQANDGVTGNSPYTINVTNADKYEFEVASDCTLTVTSDKRVVFFGIKSAAASNIVLDNDLKPATEEVTADGTQYILAKLNDVAGFAKATPDTKIAAGKGYLVIKGAAGIKEFYPFGEEDATGINTIDNEQITIDNGAVYNLSGQRVNKAQKGIYIVNGKKILK
jgi:VCBS repeat-containing protein